MIDHISVISAIIHQQITTHSEGTKNVTLVTNLINAHTVHTPAFSPALSNPIYDESTLVSKIFFAVFCAFGPFVLLLYRWSLFAGQDSGLVFSCKKCPFHSVSHDMYLAHTAEHGIAEACGIPFKPVSRSSQRRVRLLNCVGVWNKL